MMGIPYRWDGTLMDRLQVEKTWKALGWVKPQPTRYISVPTVATPHPSMLTMRSIYELTLERSLTSVPAVHFAALRVAISKFIFELILERNLILAITVHSAALRKAISRYIFAPTMEKSQIQFSNFKYLWRFYEYAFCVVGRHYLGKNHASLFILLLMSGLWGPEV